jgi:glucosylceramidase
MADETGDDYEKKLSYYYIGHFSRYIKEGAKLVWSSCYTDRIDSAAFVNPDGERVVVLLNKTDEAIPLKIKDKDSSIELEMAPHSMKTVTYFA